MNKTIVNGLKKRLEGARGNWVKELPNVLWAYRTTSRRLTGETPFSMAYGTEAVIPIEINLLSSRVTCFTQGHNDECMVSSLDALEERRDMVSMRLANYQQKLVQGYNRKVRTMGFMPKDLVLRKAISSMKDQSAGKLAPNWERPYRVTATAGAGAYYLEDQEEGPLPQSCNVYNLKKYYQSPTRKKPYYCFS